MTPFLIFRVAGTPVPQGSLRAFARRGGGRPIVTSDNERLRPWRAVVTDAAIKARQEAGLPTMGGPMMVTLAFTLRRPKSHSGRRGLLPSAPPFPAGKPDLDKLARAVLDALTDAGVWVDDAQVVELRLSKSYGDEPGLLIGMADLSAESGGQS